MNKITGQTPDLTQANIEKIAELFPQVLTEKEGEDGTTTRSIDFDLLRQLLSNSLVEGADERYRLDWPGKKRSLLKANTPITKTLRPVREESVDFDTTENLFIEGDNFEALKILQESYLGKVKMIYIDPPYNTGKDFVYSDNFTIDKAEYVEEIEAVDEEGNKMFRENTRTNPRFHSDWLSMMYERLIIARDLLRDDGVIFISIDDNEVHNLRKVCDEIFGESNLAGEFVWKTRQASGKQVASNNISTEHEYILAYFKAVTSSLRGVPRDRSAYTNPDNDPRGDWAKHPLDVGSTSAERPNCFYTLIDPDTGNEYPANPNRVWAFAPDSMRRLVEERKIIFDPNGENKPALKKFWTDLQSTEKPISSWLSQDKFNIDYNAEGTREVATLFDSSRFFDYPKPVSLLKILITQATKDDEIVLDFFSGSATTAHAVMQQNAEDGGNRRFIMVQLPEETTSDSEASKAGYKNIAELGRERIRRAAAKIRSDYAEQLALRAAPLDTGFRTYRVDDSAFLDVERHPTELEQGQFTELVNNIKANRTPEDLLTQVMLELGLTLDLPIETKQFGSNTVFYVAGNALVACFDENVPAALINEMAKIQPLQVAFRDSSFGSDDALINAETHLKRLSPDTILSVI